MSNKGKNQKALPVTFGKDIFNAFRAAFHRQFGDLDFWFSSYITWYSVRSKDVPPEVLKAYHEDSRNIKN